jgi:hypothetical protein
MVVFVAGELIKQYEEVLMMINRFSVRRRYSKIM